MLTLRCTEKLRRSLALSRLEDAPPSTTLLGDWFAKPVYTRHRRVVFCVSARTLLPVVFPAKDLRNIAAHLRESTREVLAALGLGSHAIAGEIAEMDYVTFAKTNSFSVLASMRDMGLSLRTNLERFPDWTPLDHSLWLAETPCGPLNYASPDRATQALFGGS